MQKTASQISDSVIAELQKEALAKELKSIGSKVKGLFSKKPKEIPMAKIHESPKLKPVPAAVPRMSESAAQRAKIEAQMENLRPALKGNAFAQHHAQKLQAQLDKLGPVGAPVLRKAGEWTPSDTSDEILFKLSASGKETAISKAMGWLSKGKGAKRPAYVTNEELTRSAEEGRKKLRMLSEAPSSVKKPETRGSNKPIKIPVWPHKAASQIGDDVLAELQKEALASTMQELSEGQASMLIAERVLAKLAQGEQMDPSMYEDTPARKRHWPWGAGGALAGGLAGHYLMPSDITKGYRETAKGLEGASQAAQEAYKPYYDPKAIKFQGVPEEIAAQHGVQVRDIGAGGQKVRFNAPANVARDYMKSRAWAESMPRTLGGAALGLGGGLLLSSMMS